MIPLNYNQLYYFYKIAQLGSISEASKKELISSPALSMQLKELEDNLGTELFERVGKKLILTDAGSIVYEYAKDIFKLGHELRDTLADRSESKNRLRIEIGCQETIPKKIADELVAFLIEQRNCKVTLKEGSREQLVKMQHDFKLDLILTTAIPEDNDYIFESKLLVSEKLIFVGHPKFKKIKSKWPLILNNIPMILPTFDSSSRHRLENFFHENQISPDVIAEVEDKATEIDLALRGHGVVSTLKSSVGHLLKNKMLVQMGESSIKEEIWIILGKRKILNPAAMFAMKNFKLSFSE
ncbi:MAG: LysR family transcriptional regulator [Bacteriovoracaceae bacterium]